MQPTAQAVGKEVEHDLAPKWRKSIYDTDSGGTLNLAPIAGTRDSAPALFSKDAAFEPHPKCNQNDRGSSR